MIIPNIWKNMFQITNQRISDMVCFLYFWIMQTLLMETYCVYQPWLGMHENQELPVWSYLLIHIMISLASVTEKSMDMAHSILVSLASYPKYKQNMRHANRSIHEYTTLIIHQKLIHVHFSGFADPDQSCPFGRNRGAGSVHHPPPFTGGSRCKQGPLLIWKRTSMIQICWRLPPFWWVIYTVYIYIYIYIHTTHILYTVYIYIHTKHILDIISSMCIYNIHILERPDCWVNLSDKFGALQQHGTVPPN